MVLFILFFDRLSKFLAGLVGLAIAYALSITDRLSGLVTAFTETEKQMVSVERAQQYIVGTPKEADKDYEVRPQSFICQIIMPYAQLVAMLCHCQ